ncbi:Response_reg domain-containing protein/HisKA domain-containing protein/HATPase_c domain-containing protein/CHASE domain-containing protein [Cephalotus follicularis]|uniref:histidine kinase n=1 Tax=Cephalotus follicularis TaxID=3775 RepID=A0A1Q3C2Y9_CEPFO|nr:Response_reg domain-containing protein/HisKA domain-containing protein/HATPase_c domain-containing protein/CHASE domain-containing protein [Cephalotus follicularis]
MSISCRFFIFNERLPSSFKLRKAKEPLHGPNCARKWRRKLLLLWLLVAAMVGSLLFFLSFDGRNLMGIEKSAGSCEEKAQILLRHFNVSMQQLHALASLFSESDKMQPLKCTKEPEADMALVDGIACALMFLCSAKLEFPKQHRWIPEYVKPIDQCPTPDENPLKKLDLPLLENKALLSVPQSTISSASQWHQNSEKNILETRAFKDCGKDQCETFPCCLIKYCCWVLVGMIVSCKISGFRLSLWNIRKQLAHLWPVTQHRQLQPVAQQGQALLQQKQQQQVEGPNGAGKWMMKVLVIFVLLGITGSIWLFYHLNEQILLKRVETLANMCDERARMLQDQFNVSMNHVNALAVFVSTFHHRKHPSAIDQKTFGEYTERTDFERPLTSGVAYALKVPHSEREEFEKRHGWTIKKMETEDQTLVQDCIPENLDPAPIQDEYAPVIFSQETVSHIISIDMMSGKEDRENILRARASGKGVLTSPFKLLKSNHLGVVLTFAIYNTELPQDAKPEERIDATVGYLGASYDVPSLVEKLLHQLASNQKIVVNVYDTTNASAPIIMYGTDNVTNTGLLHISSLDFGDPMRKHEMHCRFKDKSPLPWTAINSSAVGVIITLLLGIIFFLPITRIAKVENEYREMMELKARAEAADVAKSQFLATVSHEIRTPMNGVLGMVQMLMNTKLDENQLDYAQTAHASGKELILLINEVLDLAKIESGKLELEDVSFDLRAVLDNVLSQSSSNSNDKGLELAVYVSNQVPDVVIGDPGRLRQIVTNLVGNSIKFTNDRGHIFVSVHLADEVKGTFDIRDEVLKQGLNSVQELSNKTYNTLSGIPVVNRWESWENFKELTGTDAMEEAEMIRLLVTVEDTGVGIPLDAQSRIFTPFMQADSSTSRTYGGTGIGLSISKRLVHLMHGEIGFVSQPGIGSTFSFTVSLRKGKSSSLDTRWQQFYPAVSEFRGLRALVIDNRSIRAEVTRYHLQRLGISVDITFSMKLACSFLSCSTSGMDNLAMILIDKDSWDKESDPKIHHFLREHRQNGGLGVKIFLLATSISPTERNELKSAGFVDSVLMKPLRLSVIRACLQECLGNGKKRQIKRKKPSTLGNLLKEKRILVVDDNLVNRRVAEGALKKYGAIVTCVESGRAALAMLRPPHNFDACFMDLQMPEMDGFEATRQIRNTERKVNEKLASGEASKEMFNNVPHWHTPILAMTADVIQASNEECMKCGMDDYVSKPFDEEQLYSAAARFFESG